MDAVITFICAQKLLVTKPLNCAFSGSNVQTNLAQRHATCFKISPPLLRPCAFFFLSPIYVFRRWNSGSTAQKSDTDMGRWPAVYVDHCGNDILFAIPFLWLLVPSLFQRPDFATILAFAVISPQVVPLATILTASFESL